MQILKETPFVVFPSGQAPHILDPQRPGQTLCGRDVDPWRASFYRLPGPGVCVRCLGEKRLREADQVS